MLKFINLKKLTAKTLIGILMVGGLMAQSSNKQAVASNGLQGLQLRYLDSAFQCSAGGAQANISVYVYDQDDTLLATMSKEDTYITSDIDSINDLKFRYKFNNVNCISNKYTYDPNLSTYSSGNELETNYRWNNKYNVAFVEQSLGKTDDVPTLSSYSGQASISTMLTGIDSYEELYLVELGTDNSSSSSYDLQDIVLIVDNNPDGDVDNNGILDLHEIDSDIDGDGLKNFEDLDDDGDNIADVHELYTLSEISSTGTKVMIDKKRDGTEISVTLPNPPSANILPANTLNTDGEDKPDYQDTNTDNDKFADIVEAGDTDLATAPFNSDSSISGDSIADFRDLDSDDNGIIDDNEVDGDIDVDKKKNFQDLDDDDDGIIDLIEIGSNPASPTNSDNADDNPDYQDTDSDNDRILDSVEGRKDSADGTTSISITYPNSNGTPTSYYLQDSSLSDTKNNGVSCVAEGVANTCAMTSTPAPNGKVTITGKMTGLDYQVFTFAD